LGNKRNALTEGVEGATNKKKRKGENKNHYRRGLPDEKKG